MIIILGIEPGIYIILFILSPLIIFIVYGIILELLDLVFNTRKIDSSLKHSDNLSLQPLIIRHDQNVSIQSKCKPSNVNNARIQVDYLKMVSEREKNPYKRYYYLENEREINRAKALYDIFKIREE